MAWPGQQLAWAYQKVSQQNTAIGTCKYTKLNTTHIFGLGLKRSPPKPHIFGLRLKLGPPKRYIFGLRLKVYLHKRSYWDLDWNSDKVTGFTWTTIVLSISKSVATKHNKWKTAIHKTRYSTHMRTWIEHAWPPSPKQKKHKFDTKLTMHLHQRKYSDIDWTTKLVQSWISGLRLNIWTRDDFHTSLWVID